MFSTNGGNTYSNELIQSGMKFSPSSDLSESKSSESGSGSASEKAARKAAGSEPGPAGHGEQRDVVDLGDDPTLIMKS